MENLWDKIAIEKTEPTPKEIIAAQASYLSEMTNGKLQGTIKTTTGTPFLNSEADDFGTECFIHTFRINAPELGYTFTLLRLVHETLKVTPFQVFSSLDNIKYKGNTNSDLNDILKAIFTTEKVTTAIKSLIAQSPNN